MTSLRIALPLAGSYRIQMLRRRVFRRDQC